MSQDAAREGVPVGGIVSGAIISLIAFSTLCYCKKHASKKHDDNGLQMSEIVPDFDQDESKVNDNDGAVVEGCTEEDVESGSHAHGDNRFESTFARAELFFPNLGISRDALAKYELAHGKGHTDTIKVQVIELIEEKLRNLDQETRESILKGKNAKECCLMLGMNAKIVEIKFAATREFAEAMGEDFKFPSILDSIFHLIQNLDYDNPFGEVNNHIAGNYNEQNGLSYIGKSVNPENYQEVIESVETVLEKHGFGNCFMHGTTATNLQRICDSHLENSVGKHDFGTGVYCFRGRLRRALAYAFHRSWPHVNIEKKWTKNRASKNQKPKTMNISRITKDNPSVIVFPRGEAPENTTFHVGHAEYPYGDEELCTLLGKKYKAFKEGQASWRTQKDKNLPEFRWKHFVKLARCYGLVPVGKRIFRGWLHDSDFLTATERCQEPVIDVNRWEQYCFTHPLIDLRYESNMIFIELHVDWAEWVRRDINGDELAEARDEYLSIIVKPNKGAPPE